ncbi:tRNA (adenosine(37)-N6)-threonylcarbamoyltransferase complex transferase subunit TsaD [Candidatus Uhrbacteria bacterium]|jgi:N6-L-threonylcarbamoyladenine synthase|nr:tRNA (adenosine(37)-N6)-threonylcarbamoyltransferase complex transferase subunit TsaD [Candidatus Uhrbacteria bacterium]MBT7717031.1 tRNA (adenosine(37)-N6)-threonylcarbamoyltransferase complex transferase subunit TsaD [Candidatus Uhrbacteria bacterium]
MRILGIESSCDETALALVVGKGDQLKVENSTVLSQIQTHQQYGGVVPEVAAREHLAAIFPMLEREIPFDGKGIDAVAVTSGPGLAPALRIGVEVAKTLAWSWGVPLVGVCHLEGHIYASWLPRAKRLFLFLPQKTPIFPALSLIVSGGHTELVLMHDHGRFERIGETMDDAAGEAFDKVAKMLGLPYPGGPHIARLAVGGDTKAFDFPRGLLDRDNFEFSFSGLKTSVLYTLRKNEDKLENVEFRQNIAASFQEAAVDVLTQKSMKAIEKYKPKSFILAGGVAANIELRKRIKKEGTRRATKVFVPPFTYSVDNAAMIAVAGYFRAQNDKNFVEPEDLAADSNMDIV